MPGGLLNIVSVGNINVFLTGNPSKTFFKVAYAKYTNFGLQRFRLDYEGSRDLRLTESSKFTFKMKRYADLLMDTYLVVTLPDIYSPIHPPTSDTSMNWSPYEFRWIEQLGALMIQEIEITSGSTVLQRYSGQYIAAMVERDFSDTKKEMFNRMSGNTKEMHDPANWTPRVQSYPYMPNTYPSVKAHMKTSVVAPPPPPPCPCDDEQMPASTAVPFAAAAAGCGSCEEEDKDGLCSQAYVQEEHSSPPGPFEPSIRGRQLYIPMNAWFTLNSRCAFPLASLQYNELIINVTLRPIQDLFRVRDVFDVVNYFPYVRPDFNQDRFQMYRFLQSPPEDYKYENTTRLWNADVHVMATYCFLSNDEKQVFAVKDQIYLVKDVFEYDYLNITGTSKIKLESSSGMVSNWMFYFQRNDVNLRNEWWNFSNWPYENVLPQNVTMDQQSSIYVNGPVYAQNRRDIMETFGVVIEGEYRENVLPRGIYDFIEKYTRTDGNGKDGLYLYNFCLTTSPFDYQPSGAFNLSKFKNIEFEFTTFLPPVDTTNSQYNVVCDDGGTPLAVSTKPAWAFYVYNYNLHVFEERYNILSFIKGNCGLMYAR
jgi:hypothetical protein